MSPEWKKGKIIFYVKHIDINSEYENSKDRKFLLYGKIFFVIGYPVAGMGMMDKEMVGAAFEHENYKGSGKRDLRLVGYTSGGEDDDDRNEVEEVVVYQGRNQLFR